MMPHPDHISLTNWNIYANVVTKMYMNNTSDKPKDIGAAWIKSGNYGDYISISLEINGAKHNFTMFPNKYKKEGSKQPDYRIPAPRSDSKPSSQDDKYNAQLDQIIALKAANAAKVDTSASYNQPATFTEDDLPF